MNAWHIQVHITFTLRGVIVKNVGATMKLSKTQKRRHLYHSTYNMVCIPCRKAGKLLSVCFQCHEDMINIGKRWRVPKKDDLKGWKQLLTLPQVQYDLKQREEAKRGTETPNDNQGTSGIPKASKKKHFSRRYNLRRGISVEGFALSGNVGTRNWEG